MPGYNRKGPNGDGPKTGRSKGYCSKKTQYKVVEEETIGRGRGGEGLRFNRSERPRNYFNRQRQNETSNEDIPQGELENRIDGQGLGPCGQGLKQHLRRRFDYKNK
ncbi:MAG: DUF5320 domain-containing protein [archaeon]